MQKLPNITSLRFFLALLVMIFHIPQFFHNRGLPYFNDLPIFNKGTEAVYMFFSLSGFLIIKQLFFEKEINGKIDLKKFYIRRALRILPLYYLIALTGILYYNFFLPNIGIEMPLTYNLIDGIILLLVFLPNVLHLSKPGGILEILWSIGIEEQFYLFIAPIIVLIPSKRTIFFLLAFSFIFIFLYHSSLFSFLMKYKMMFFYFSFAGFCSFLKIRANRYSETFNYIIYISVILYFTTNIFTENLSQFQYNLLSMILFGFFLHSFTQKTFRFFQNKSLVYFGKISYGIYMYHSVVMQLVGFLFLNFFSKCNLSHIETIITSFLLVIIITLLVSHFSYRFYEKKFLNMKRDYRVLK